MTNVLHRLPAQGGARIGPEEGRSWEGVRPENMGGMGAMKQEL